jgi:predicted O-linked N-acetylglucosamine transferase (SPINDLY family)
MGASVVHYAGLPELVARSADEYVEIAVRLAADTQKLKQLRTAMREKLLASTLCDATGFAANLEAAYRQMAE